MKISRFKIVILFSVFSLLALCFLLVFFPPFRTQPINPSAMQHYSIGFIGDNSFVLPRETVEQMSQTISPVDMRQMYRSALSTKAAFFRFSERDLAEWTLASIYSDTDREQEAALYAQKAVTAKYTPIGGISVGTT